MIILIKNANVFIEDEFINKDVYIMNEEIFFSIEDTPDIVIDGTDKFLIPGLIDVHVHLRQPGFAEKETIKSGTRAAARGGFTDVCSMPNVNPTTSDISSLNMLLEIINKDAVVNVHPYGSISKSLFGTELSNYNEINDFVCAYSDDGVGVQKRNIMKKAMIEIHKLNKKVVAHCENNLFIVSDNRKAEYSQIARDIKLVRETGVSYHICHISTSNSIELVRQAKKEGLPVTCEVTPHHLTLNENNVLNKTYFKMNPPLRSVEDVNACVNGLIDGTIDVIATDHAPHTKEEKAKPFNEAPNGIVGLETAFSIIYTLFVKNNIISIEKMIELMSIKPGVLFNLDNTIKEGNTANLVLVDLDKEYFIDSSKFESLGVNTPYNNKKVYGSVLVTIVNGNLVYKEGEFYE